MKRVRKKLFLFFVLLLLMNVTACNKSTGDNRVTRTNFLLDTIIQITAYGPNAEDAIIAAFDRISDIQNKMTAVGHGSEITKINDAAGISFQKMSPDTFFVLKRGLYYSEKFKGRFDITIGPLVKLWGIGTEDARVPSAKEIENALEKVNYKALKLNEQENSAMLENEGMSIDLGAIAKGYAADEVIRILKERGIKSAVADLGGNIFVLGHKPDGSPWRVGIQNPFDSRGSTFAIVEVTDKTLVTSGIYERYFEENGKRYHHILDTYTGYPVENDLASVTIFSDSSIDADALSTSIFSLGLKEGIKQVEAIPDTEAIFVTKDYKVYITSGVKDYGFKITDQRFELVN